MIMYYAQIGQNSIVVAVTETAGAIDAEDMIKIESFDESLLGMLYSNGQFVPAPLEPTWIITRNALQNRFPLTSNGVSTKYDLMTLFLTDNGYAESLGVTGSDLYSLRSITITGNNRLGAVSSVDLKAPETISYVQMCTNVAFPEVFRLTQAEADAILNTPATSNETP